MSELGDERLARRAAAGDRRAFEQIYRRYSQPLYRFCLAMLGDSHDAQDALQNTMVKVLRALPGEQREIKLKPWLYRIARNEAVETLRRRREQPEADLEQAAPSASQIAERAEDRERLRTLFVDLESLPERQRGALVMRELSGLSFEEIGKAFDTSPATARQTVYEARLSLRQMEKGREMRCDEVMRALSDADGRLLRRRDLRAHLRGCPSCRAFDGEMDERRSELAALAPLPLVASTGILHGILAGQAQGGLVGKAIATSALVKSTATVAVVAVVGVSAADRAGLIDAGLPGHGGGAGGSSAESASRTGTPASEQPGASTERTSNRKAAGFAAKVSGRRPSKGAHDETVTTPRSPSAASRFPEEVKAAGAANGAHGGKATGHGAGHARGLPAASAHGQETAAAHKSPQANPSPGTSDRGHGDTREKGGGAAQGASAPPPAPAQKPDAPPGKEAAPRAGGASPPVESSTAAEHGPDGEGHGPFQR